VTSARSEAASSSHRRASKVGSARHAAVVAQFSGGTSGPRSMSTATPGVLMARTIAPKRASACSRGVSATRAGGRICAAPVIASDLPFSRR